MRWHIRHGDILDQAADVLICSANPSLNLSGGVGGALLLRYGATLQTELHNHLARQDRRYLDCGSVVVTHPPNTPYRAIVHAVAVNAFYESSPQIITEVVRASLRSAANCGAKVVSLTALATGYGRLTMPEFASGLTAVVNENFSPIKDVIIVVRKDHEATELSRAIPVLHVM